MKILLVNPYIYDFTAYDLWLRPLGLLYIAAVLKKYTACELYWLDTLDRFQQGAYPAGDKRAKKTKPDGRGKYHREAVEKPVIYRETPRSYARYGIPFKTFSEKLNKIPSVDIILVTSLMTYWIDGMKITIDTLKRRFPSAKIVMGGVLPTLVPEDILKNHMDVDYLIKGYGENKILEFIKEHGGGVYSYPDFSDIDTIPYPAVEFLSNKDVLPLMTSRGCPFHCTYCASDILNPRFLERSADKVLEEIYFLHDTYATRDFVIFDDALLINKQKRFLKVFQKVSETLDVHFHTPNGLHAGEIDRETAETFFKSGFKMMRLSFESTRSEILSMSSDKVTVRQMKTAVENLEAAGYKRKDIDVYLLFGVPGQRLEDIEEALAFVKGLGVTPHLSYFSPVPGTIDFIDLQKSGVLSTPVNLYETNKIYFVYNKSGFSFEEVKHIKDQAAVLQML
ncbi:MAG: radical SAM protein [Candidatus Aminicenantes bacterium]|nr:radical SAM protein [Candidatus Aminicenantes bacterium]NIM78912.1 radical SAM protein [Candidatus Aminicenantes bacterium]NIN18172.1 radical SAM protein [Candidatus Aminicenantes bacterium]NIN42071.1 radical SAM protein [Candidatus Aminicenantes bacterium]NIN84824.1 radical SAM protein [Candidatus Aminicenantes bacterium]